MKPISEHVEYSLQICNSMKQIPRQANRRSSSQEIPRFYRNRKFISMSTTARNRSPFCALSIQSSTETLLP
jgi:hypothetical protein